MCTAKEGRSWAAKPASVTASSAALSHVGISTSSSGVDSPAWGVQSPAVRREARTWLPPPNDRTSCTVGAPDFSPLRVQRDNSYLGGNSTDNSLGRWSGDFLLPYSPSAGTLC